MSPLSAFRLAEAADSVCDKLLSARTLSSACETSPTSEEETMCSSIDISAITLSRMAASNTACAGARGREHVCLFVCVVFMYVYLHACVFVSMHYTPASPPAQS